MDKMIYIAMTGAQHTLHAQQINANNIANVDTPGFKADIARFKAISINGDGFNSRTYALSDDSGSDLSAGSIIQTGRDMDVAVRGNGWMAVVNDDGTESYSRSGSLKINENGLLTNSSEQIIAGNGGPITIPPYQKLEIGIDGTVSIIPENATGAETIVLDRIKLVSGDSQNMQKSLNGLFATKDGQPLEVDSNIKIESGYIEGSNVNAVEAMTNMISLARQFEIQMKLMSEAQENDQQTASLLRLNN